MVELVDTQDLKSCGHYGCAGSIPAPGTTAKPHLVRLWSFFEKITAPELRQDCAGVIL